jgi:hypothetical protein
MAVVPPEVMSCGVPRCGPRPGTVRCGTLPAACGASGRSCRRAVQSRCNGRAARFAEPGPVCPDSTERRARAAGPRRSPEAGGGHAGSRTGVDVRRDLDVAQVHVRSRDLDEAVLVPRNAVTPVDAVLRANPAGGPHKSGAMRAQRVASSPDMRIRRPGRSTITPTPSPPPADATAPHHRAVPTGPGAEPQAEQARRRGRLPRGHRRTPRGRRRPGGGNHASVSGPGDLSAPRHDPRQAPRPRPLDALAAHDRAWPCDKVGEA